MHIHLPAAAVTVTLGTSPDPAWPDIARPDAGAVLLSTWTVDTPDRQQATIDAFSDAWRSSVTRYRLAQSLARPTEGA